MSDSNAIDKFNLAKSIILASSTLKLFGFLFYKFAISLNNSAHLTALAFKTKNVYQNKDQLNISISKKFIDTLENANELVYIILHEMVHILNKHLSRGFNAAYQILFNIAADHVINSALDADIRSGALKGLKSPNSRVIINSLEGQNLSVEEVYKYLADHATITTEKFTFDPNGSDECQANGENDEDGSEEGENQGKGKPNKNTTIELTKVHVKMDDGQEFTYYQDFSADGQDVENAEQDIQDDARRILNSPIYETSKNKGSGSSKMMELIQEAVKVEIPWTELLESVIKTNITEKSDNKSWSRVNKRMYPYNMILPYNDMEETYDTLWIIVDTSGSISSYELKKVVHIVKTSMYHFKRVIKIDHDVQCYDKYKKIYDSTTIDNLETDISIEFTGRGGTSHKYVYDYIESIYEENSMDSAEMQVPGLILFITDFESDIQSIHHTYKWPKEIPYKYIITTNSKFPVDPSIDKNPIWILNEN